MPYRERPGTKDDLNSLALGCVSENNTKYLAQTLRLLQSVRWFGGLIANAPFFVCVIDSIDPDFKSEFLSFDAQVRIVSRFSPKHPQSNKIRLLELEEIKNFSRVLLLDCDTIVVQDPGGRIDRDVPLHAKIADFPTVPLPVFERVFNHFGLTMPATRLECTVNGEPIIPYFNAGVLLFSKNALRELVPAWVAFNNKLLDRIDLLENNSNFCEQASLSLAVAATGTEFQTFGNEMNFPAHVDEHMTSLENVDPCIIHYHWKADSSGCLEEVKYPLVNRRIKAFNDRLRMEKRKVLDGAKRGEHDIDDATLRLAIENSKHPETLKAVVNTSRRHFGWFSKTAPRIFEYPWVFNEINSSKDLCILDIGAGVSPLPLMLAENGASVITIDNSAHVRIMEQGPEHWNEWGFLDYGTLDPRIKSMNENILSAPFADNSLDCAYSVSVIEHMPASVRRQLWKQLKKWLKDEGSLLLTIDLVPGTDQLWPYSEGELVESAEIHGNAEALQKELFQEGFVPVKQEIFRGIKSARTDCMLLSFVKGNCKEKQKIPNKTRLDNTAVLILGMHRSGTSAITGCLCNSGLYLGQTLLPPTGDNPRGYFEHKEIYLLHEKLLAAIGSSWDDPRPLPDGFQADPRISPFRERFRKILLRDFAGVPLWGIKDPRICRLLPLWLPLLEELNVNVKAVHVVRHPAEVAASLAARNAMPEAQALVLWLRHVLAAELASRRLPRSVIFYEALLAGWRGEIERVDRELDLHLPDITAEAEERVSDFLAPGLRHHKSQKREISGPVQNLALEAFDAFAAWRRDNVSACAMFDEIDRTMQNAGIERAVIEYLEGRISSFNTVIAQLEDDITQRDMHIGNLEAVAVQKDLYIGNLEAAAAQRNMHVSQKDMNIGNLEAAAAQKDLHIGSLEAALKEKSASLDAIYNSHSWKMLLGYYRLRDKILPAGSGQRRVVKSVTRKVVGSVSNAVSRSKKIDRKPDKAVHGPDIPPAPPRKRKIKNSDDGVSIIIPTFNGGDLFKRCLNRIREQSYSGAIQLIVIDSGSSDGTCEAAERAMALVKKIDGEKFHHSRTRNEAVSLAKYNKIVFMVQDALPVSSDLLEKMVHAFDEYDVAAVYGAQIPHEEADLYARFEIDYHREYLGASPSMQFIDSGELFMKMEYDQALRRVRMDNVCAIYDAGLLKKFPFPEIPFAEDMAWCSEMMMNGYRIMYHPEIVVQHSHNRSPEYRFRRAVASSLACAEILGRVKYNLSFLDMAAYGQVAERLDLLLGRVRGEISSTQEGFAGNGGSNRKKMRLYEKKLYKFFEKLVPLMPNMFIKKIWIEEFEELAGQHMLNVLSLIRNRYGGTSPRDYNACLEQVSSSMLGGLLGDIYASRKIAGKLTPEIEQVVGGYTRGI